ncbi:hypothetical protein BAUCODRAFT_31702 [Baudoinia panamericana UAMH 10762]|uniref:Zinc/iron permease n=1 Tax=Baudoinia panamericana (strain UAMH 10762) TaxID=717646 RepID=M2N5S6_BAUPA|nr:uncharacterized protein BAUCODRAFT_31702 [Baudoinia panamericana UAMH 10762]EMC99383.1 hypothetical protein BAUCODRAFT_31702 [Baudoinia panamericana UAMH 10762]
MEEGVFTLVLLCVVMACASFLAGALPLSFSLTSRQLRLMTALGTGVLVGTALIVIIPEGIETLYSADGSTHSHSHSRMKRSLTTGGPVVWTPDIRITHKFTDWQRFGPPVADATGNRLDVHAVNPTREDDVSAPDSIPNNEGTTPDQNTYSPPRSDPHAWVGISLITGFILMYLIDTLPRHITTHSPSPPRRFSISLNSFSFNRPRTSTSDTASLSTPTTDTFSSSDPHPHPHPHHHANTQASSTTVGLVIHAVADGIALGASTTTTTTSNTQNLTFIIFLALMIHKAPAAFGLTAVLLKQGLSKRMARFHLLIFSCAAPAGAVLTWTLIRLGGYSPAVLGESASAEFATGVLLLFSAGTFLYVAVHTMQESGSGHEHVHVAGNGYLGVPGTEMGMDGMEAGMYGQPVLPVKREGPELVETLVTVGGMLLPLLTQWGHAH